MKETFHLDGFWTSLVIFSILSYPIAESCLAQQNSPVERVDGCSRFESLAILLKHPFIDAYGEEKAKEIRCYDLSFSPDGRLLAVSIGGITTNGPEQVWIIDLKNKKVRPATENTGNGSASRNIMHTEWISSDTISIQIYRNGALHCVRATKDYSIDFPLPTANNSEFPYYYSVSSSPSGHFRIISTGDTTSVVDVLHNTIIQRIKSYRWDDIKWSPDERFFMFIKDHGSGDLSLYVGTPTQRLKISEVKRGNWELEGACFSPTRKAIAYPIMSDVPAYGVAIYSIDKKRVVKVITTGPVPLLVAWGIDDKIAVYCKSCTQPSQGSPKSNEITSWNSWNLYLLKLQ
jgi:hypothetical protein